MSKQKQICVLYYIWKQTYKQYQTIFFLGRWRQVNVYCFLRTSFPLSPSLIDCTRTGVSNQEPCAMKWNVAEMDVLSRSQPSPNFRPSRCPGCLSVLPYLLTLHRGIAWWSWEYLGPSWSLLAGNDTEGNEWTWSAAAFLIKGFRKNNKMDKADWTWWKRGAGEVLRHQWLVYYITHAQCETSAIHH